MLAAALIPGEGEIQLLRPDAARSAERARQRGRELFHQVEPNPQRDEVNRSHRSP